MTELPETPTGPKKWVEFMDKLKEFIREHDIVDVTEPGDEGPGLDRQPAGTILKAGGGSSEAGADNLEEVTGAVNGVPATINVQTDGEGWTEI